MADSNQPVINITELDHVCMVVRDLDKSLESMWNNFGIGPWNIYLRGADSMRNMTYHGKPARFGFKVGRLQKKLGDTDIELVEPIEGDNIYRDFLEEHGEGFQHVGSYKVSSLEAFNEATRMLEEAGFPCIMSAHGRTAFAYFDTTKLLKTVLEVVWWDPVILSQSRSPERVFPEK